MESIPLEQLALTCKILRDNRVLELYRELEECKPHCIIIDGVLHVTSKMFKGLYKLWYGPMKGELRENINLLIQAMEKKEAFGFQNYYGDNYLMTNGTFFTVTDDYETGLTGLHEITVDNECIIDEFRKY